MLRLLFAYVANSSIGFTTRTIQTGTNYAVGKPCRGRRLDAEIRTAGRRHPIESR